MVYEDRTVLDCQDRAQLRWVLLLFIKVIQNVVEFLAVGTYAYLARSLWKKRVYNTNLSLLLIFLPIPSVIGILMYTARDVIMFTGCTSETIIMIVDSVQNAGMFGGALNLPNFVVDRLCATLMPTMYESKRFPWIALTMILIQLVLTSMVVLAYQTRMIPFLYQTIIFTISCVMSVVVFSILPAITKKIHEHHRNSQAPVTILVSILVMTHSHPKLMRALPCMRKKTQIAPPCNMTVISSDGRILSFSAVEEQKIYFDNYKTMWTK
ncbi:unnamed protein product [Cylicocyclus nassatus]|uniref:Uncharacterized protein n=1 Tax=Cylicocyclus nassatus TaxID=53992 RepID=A0AA36HCD0_CYLNA|nr:unnamed protein product [Cylicocyclus nassatus]